MVTKQLSLENIFQAVRLNCPCDPNADKPLQLIKMPGRVKHRGVGRFIFLYYGIKAGHDGKTIQDFLGMTADEYLGKKSKLNELVTLGRQRFEYDPNGPEDTYTFFYRKFLLVKSYLAINHRFIVDDPTIY